MFLTFSRSNKSVLFWEMLTPLLDLLSFLAISRNLKCFSAVEEDGSLSPEMNDPPLLEDVEFDIADDERKSNVPRHTFDEFAMKLSCPGISGGMAGLIKDIPASLS